jgi:hypothetical protein
VPGDDGLPLDDPPFAIRSRCARAGPRANGLPSRAAAAPAECAAAPAIGAVTPGPQVGAWRATPPMFAGSGGGTGTDIIAQKRIHRLLQHQRPQITTDLSVRSGLHTTIAGTTVFRSRCQTRPSATRLNFGETVVITTTVTAADPCTLSSRTPTTTKTPAQDAPETPLVTSGTPNPKILTALNEARCNLTASKDLSSAIRSH